MSHFNQCWRDFRFFFRTESDGSLVERVSWPNEVSVNGFRARKRSQKRCLAGVWVGESRQNFFRRKKAISRALLRKQSGPEWADIFQTNSGDFFPIYIPRPRNMVHLFWFSFGEYVLKSWISVHVDCQYVTEFCPSIQNWTHFCWQTDEIKLFSFHQTVEDSL